MLVVFGGLPGTGKTTLARIVARVRGEAYVRIDTIEQALRESGMLAGDVGPAGYIVAYAMAESNLRQGLSVVADCVNPLDVTRAAWRGVAEAAGARIVEIEVVCSDEAEHRRRIETRVADIAGLVLPDWASVQGHEYEPWREARIVLDTSGQSIADAATALLAKLENA